MVELRLAGKTGEYGWTRAGGLLALRSGRRVKEGDEACTGDCAKTGRHQGTGRPRSPSARISDNRKRERRTAARPDVHDAGRSPDRARKPREGSATGALLR